MESRVKTVYERLLLEFPPTFGSVSSILHGLLTRELYMYFRDDKSFLLFFADDTGT